MLKKFFIIFDLLTASDKRSLLFILSLAIFNSLLNVVGIASILPFIGLISEPELFETNKYILQFRELFGLESYNSTVITFAVISFSLILLSNVSESIDSWYTTLFGFKKEEHFSKKLLRNYLYKDDLSFSQTKNSERVKNILSDVDRVVLDTLFSMLELIASILLAIFIFALLLIVDPMATLIITLALLIVYLVVFKFASTRLDNLGQEFTDIESDMYSEVLEALALQRDIKLAQVQSYFTRRYKTIFDEMVSNRMKFELISIIPQRIIEVVAFGSILLIAALFVTTEDSASSAITMVSIYAFATYRLMPAISDIFDSVEQIKFGSAVLERIVQDLNFKPHSSPESSPIKFHKTIQISGVDFQFRNGPRVIKNLRLTFEKGRFYCVKGKTGCGKSTLLLLLAGLYKPQAGEFFLDDKKVELYQNKSWYSQISFVSANVKLIEGTILDNIIFGRTDREIDLNKIEQLAKLVDLHEHIVSLDEGYESLLGTEGTTFSSGQAQKLGIIRALYSNPSVLLFDESSDALDLATEEHIFNQLKGFEDLTIIFVSHRSSIHDIADQVIDLEKVLKEK